MTDKEKVFIDKLLAVGLELIRDASKENLMDINGYLDIAACPKDGWVSVGFTKDGIKKCGCRFHAYPDPDYSETVLDE